MSGPDPQNTDPQGLEPDAREAARRMLMGRAMVVGLLLLTAIYALFTYLGRR